MKEASRQEQKAMVRGQEQKADRGELVQRGIITSNNETAKDSLKIDMCSHVPLVALKH